MDPLHPTRRRGGGRRERERVTATHRLLLVWKDNIAMESLHHEQCLAQRSRSFPQDLIRLHGYDGTEGKDEGVDILHVEVVGCHGIGDGIVGEALRKKDMKITLRELCL